MEKTAKKLKKMRHFTLSEYLGILLPKITAEVSLI